MAASTADGAVGSALSAIQTFYETRCYWSNPEIQLLYYPVVAYWLLALFYDFLGSLRTPWVLKQRVHPPADDKANRMSKGHVIRRVILAHVIQTALGVFMLIVDPPKDNANGSPLKVALQVVMAAFVMDAWQYAIHRYMHENKTLYRLIHSHHHKLVVPYAYGALYNQPLESLLLDALGAAVSLYATGMSSQVAVYFFTFATCKTVWDHSNFKAPLNPMHSLFSNNAVYHDVHHDPRGIKKNFSQPFFTLWDRLLGTYMDPAELQKLKQKDT